MTQLMTKDPHELVLTDSTNYRCFWGLEEGLGRSLAEYEPVLSLTIIRQGQYEQEILMGVRTSLANNTHENVWSVPTKRIEGVESPAEWKAILDRNGGMPLSAEGLRECASSLRLWTNYLMMLKLGAANLMETRRLDYEILKLGAWQGVSLIDYIGGQDVTEALTMFNLAVMITAGDSEFPSRTLSYDPLTWVPISRFLLAAETKNIYDLGVPMDPLRSVEMCIRGLCVETSTLMLQGDL